MIKPSLNPASANPGHAAKRFTSAILCLGLAACASAPLPVWRPVQPPRQPAASLPPPVSVPPAPAVAVPVPVAPATVSTLPVTGDTGSPPLGVPGAAGPTDKAAVLQSWVEQQQQLYRVAAPLLISNTELCPAQARPLLGFTAKNKYSYSNEFVEPAATALGLGDKLQVMGVLPGSAAAAAGLQKGDILLAANIEPLPEGPNAESAAAPLIASELRGKSSLRLGIERSGASMGLDIPLTLACAMTIDLGNTPEVAGYSDGRRVMVTRGMIDFARSDQELAYVLAKEMAANVLDAAPRPQNEALISQYHQLAQTTPDAAPLAALRPTDSVTDIATDTLSLYLLTRAGYDAGGAVAFWQRLAASDQPPGSVGYARLHPVTEARLANMRNTLRAIAAKLRSGAPMAP